MAKIYCKSSYLLRRDKAENWSEKNPILRDGEEGYETDTGKRKVGDGTTEWNNLKYDSGIVDQTYTPESENAQSGKAVAEALVVAKEYTDAKIDPTYSPTSENAQSGKAVAEAVAIEQKRSDNTFANALKGSKTGTAILIDDISPVTHKMSVKISSDTVEDLTAVKVSRYGKNLLNEKAVSPIAINGDGLERYGWNLGILPQGNYTLSVYGNYDLSKPISYKTITNGVYSKFVALTDVAKPLTIALNGSQELIVYLFQGITELYDNVTLQLEKGVGTEYEPYITPIEYTPSADGTVNGVTSLYPNTTLMTDTEGVLIDCEYNRDINKAFAALEAAIATNNS